MNEFTRKRKRSSRYRSMSRQLRSTLTAERLECRALMAADAFEAIPQDAAYLGLHDPVAQDVRDMGPKIQEQFWAEYQLESQPDGQSMVLGAIPLTQRQQLIGQGVGPELRTGQAGHPHTARTDLAITELMEIPRSAVEHQYFQTLMQGGHRPLETSNEQGLSTINQVPSDVSSGAREEGLRPVAPTVAELPDLGYAGSETVGLSGGLARPTDGRMPLTEDTEPLPREQGDEVFTGSRLDNEDVLASEASQRAGASDFWSLPLADADADGIVGFSDFVIVSTNFGRSVDGRAGGDFNADGMVDFSDFVRLSNSFGEHVEVCGNDDSDANDPTDGTEIQDAGDLKIRAGSHVFISDKTVNGDKDNLIEDAPEGTPVHEGMKSWQDVIDKLKDLPDGSITGDLVLSGHGANGGVDASNSNIDGENLTKEQAEIIKKKLGPNARIVVLGCSQADAEDNDHMQRMADMTGKPVVGNQGSVSDGTHGSGDWFRFDPKK